MRVRAFSTTLLAAVVSGWGCLGSLDYLGGAGAAGSTGAGGASCDDVLSDAANCGICGHSCLDGACTDGKCQPVIVADLQDQPNGIGVDAEHVYWANRGSREIRRAPLHGGADELFVASAPPVEFVPTNLVVQPLRVVWINVEAGQNGGFALISRSKMGGGTAGFAPSSPDGNGGLASDGSIFYFTNYGASAVRAAELGKEFATVAMDQAGPGEVAVDATHVYWTNSQEGVGGVMRTARPGGGDAESLSADVKVATGITLDDEFVYVTSGTEVLRLPKQGGAYVRLAKQQFNPAAVVVDGSRVYWVNTGSPGGAAGEVVTVDTAGMEQPVVLAVGQASPSFLALDAEQIYWTNAGSDAPGTGSVMRMAR